jgi:hypothetical protein
MGQDQNKSPIRRGQKPFGYKQQPHQQKDPQSKDTPSLLSSISSSTIATKKSVSPLDRRGGLTPTKKIISQKAEPI